MKFDKIIVNRDEVLKSLTDHGMVLTERVPVGTQDSETVAKQIVTIIDEAGVKIELPDDFNIFE